MHVDPLSQTFRDLRPRIRGEPSAPGVQLQRPSSAAKRSPPPGGRYVSSSGTLRERRARMIQMSWLTSGSRQEVINTERRRPTFEVFVIKTFTLDLEDSKDV